MNVNSHDIIKINSRRQYLGINKYNKLKEIFRQFKLKRFLSTYIEFLFHKID